MPTTDALGNVTKRMRKIQANALQHHLQAIKDTVGGAQQNVDVLLYSLVQCRNTDAWHALQYLLKNLLGIFIERAAYAETEEERLVSRGAIMAIDSLIEATVQASTALGTPEDEADAALGESIENVAISNLL
jgi:hypothetical protein